MDGAEAGRSFFERVRVVLVRPQGPRNVGMAARAIKNMGFRQLSVVGSPELDLESAHRACSRADEILDSMGRYDSLPDALRGASLVAATTSRVGRARGTMLEPWEIGARFASQGGEGDLVLVFGQEDHGLSNRDLDFCNLRVSIPASPEYPSLNLAQAVQVLAYELRLAGLGLRPMAAAAARPAREVADRQDMEGLYGHLRTLLETVGFLNEENPFHIMAALRQLLDRAELDLREVRILRGVLSDTLRMLRG